MFSVAVLALAHHQMEVVVASVSFVEEDVLLQQTSLAAQQRTDKIVTNCEACSDPFSGCEPCDQSLHHFPQKKSVSLNVSLATRHRVVKNHSSVAHCEACASSTCSNGDSSNGGRELVGGHCEHSCSIFYGEHRYCGAGCSYEGIGSVDCSTCLARRKWSKYKLGTYCMVPVAPGYQVWKIPPYCQYMSMELSDGLSVVERCKALLDSAEDANLIGMAAIPKRNLCHLYANNFALKGKLLCPVWNENWGTATSSQLPGICHKATLSSECVEPEGVLKLTSADMAPDLIATYGVTQCYIKAGHESPPSCLAEEAFADGTTKASHRTDLQLSSCVPEPEAGG